MAISRRFEIVYLSVSRAKIQFLAVDCCRHLCRFLTANKLDIELIANKTIGMQFVRLKNAHSFDYFQWRSAASAKIMPKIEI